MDEVPRSGRYRHYSGIHSDSTLCIKRFPDGNSNKCSGHGWRVCRHFRRPRSLGSRRQSETARPTLCRAPGIAGRRAARLRTLVAPDASLAIETPQPPRCGGPCCGGGRRLGGTRHTAYSRNSCVATQTPIPTLEAQGGKTAPLGRFDDVIGSLSRGSPSPLSGTRGQGNSGTDGMFSIPETRGRRDVFYLVRTLSRPAAPQLKE